MALSPSAEALELLAAALPTAASPAAAARQLLLRAHEAGVAVSHPLLWRCASCLPAKAGLPWDSISIVSFIPSR